MQEVWKDIKEYEGRYQISNLAMVKSVQRIKANARGKYMANERLLKTNISSSGYYRIVFKLNDKYKTYFLHRLLAIAFIPNPENKPFINHKDGNKLNNSLENLEWCTMSENRQHAYNTGLQNPTSGEIHGMCKLTENQVIDIRKRINNGEMNNEISKIYNVSHTLISKIKNRNRWKHLK